MSDVGYQEMSSTAAPLQTNETILWRSTEQKGIFHRHVAAIIEVTSQAVIPVRVLDELPGEVFCYTWDHKRRF